jgi:hypothetical protein
VARSSLPPSVIAGINIPVFHGNLLNELRTDARSTNKRKFSAGEQQPVYESFKYEDLYTPNGDENTFAPEKIK